MLGGIVGERVGLPAKRDTCWGLGGNENGRGGSEVQILLVVTRRQRPAHAWGASGSLDGPAQDQQGLIQTAIVKGRCLAEGLGDEPLGQLELIQD